MKRIVPAPFPCTCSATAHAIRACLIALLCAALFPSALFAQKPLIGLVGIETRSPRAANIASMVENHLANIIASAGPFSQLNQAQLKRELAAFGCMDEACMLRFARTAKLGLVIRGVVEDEGDVARLDLFCYATGDVYAGKLVYRYRARIPITRPDITARELSYLGEEHTGAFIAGVLRAYRRPVSLSVREGGVRLDEASSGTGSFMVYRFIGPPSEEGAPREYAQLGELELDHGSVVKSANAGALRDGDFILVNYVERADYLDEFYRGRKRELVLQWVSPLDTLYVALFAVPAGVTMPVLAPLGYYAYGDYRGLGLWAVNALPWLYLEADGFLNRPSAMRDRNESVSRTRNARYDFALYMALSGGIPLFVDAFAHRYLADASEYAGSQQVIGNSWTAGFLAAVSPGGGHFYRGSRLWGYLYFHLDNFLVYSIMKEFARAERYDAAQDRYVRASGERGRGHTLLYALGAVKLIEIVHAVLTPDDIGARGVEAEPLAFQPVLYRDARRRPVLGAGVSLRY